MDYKLLAKNRLDGNWGLVIGAMLLTAVISVTVTAFFKMVLPIGDGSESRIISYLSGNSRSMIVGILFYPMTMGMSRIYLRIIEKYDASISDLFLYYTIRFWGSVKTILLVAIFTFLWTLLLIIPGIIKSFSYSMTNFIFVDKDFDLDGLEAITLSREMMDGRKFDLFVLYLSFIGWFVLLFISPMLVFVSPVIGLILFFIFCAVLILYVTPYIEASITVFYLEVKREYLRKSGMKLKNEFEEEGVEVIL